MLHARAAATGCSKGESKSWAKNCRLGEGGKWRSCRVIVEVEHRSALFPPVTPIHLLTVKKIL